MYITPAQGLTLTSVLRGILGICVLLFIACLLSKDRKKIDWKIVVTGLSSDFIGIRDAIYSRTSNFL